MDSKIALIIQIAGVLSITALLFLLTESLKTGVLKYWKAAWLMLSFSLVSLQIGFNLKEYNKIFFIFYYFGEYFFGYFLILGCYYFTTQKSFPYRIWYFTLPCLAISSFLTLSGLDFNRTFNIHTFLMGSFFTIAFLALKKTETSQKNMGWRIMRFSLLFLILDFYHYTVLFTLDQKITTAYLSYNPVIDLILEMLLGFGTVIVLFEKVKSEGEVAHRQLQEAHQKLETLAHTDPLTTAFNRHAFYGFLHKKNQDESAISGCVGFFDIDDLKPINDLYGHHVGDIIIRQASASIRSLMRSDDLIFRWGGDEFFVVMISMDENFAYQRMSRINDSMNNLYIGDIDETLSINISIGFANFSNIAELETAVKSADEKMYLNKQDRKQKNAVIANLAANPANLNQLPHH